MLLIRLPFAVKFRALRARPEGGSKLDLEQNLGVPALASLGGMGWDSFCGMRGCFWAFAGCLWFICRDDCDLFVENAPCVVPFFIRLRWCSFICFR